MASTRDEANENGQGHSKIVISQSDVINDDMKCQMCCIKDNNRLIKVLINI